MNVNKHVICRPARPGAAAASGGDPALLPDDVARVHPESAQRRRAVRRALRQDPRHPVGAAHARHAELKHVHLAQTEEPQTARLPRGDLGRGGRGGAEPARHHPRLGALASAPETPAHRLPSFSRATRTPCRTLFVRIARVSDRRDAREISEYMCC